MTFSTSSWTDDVPSTLTLYTYSYLKLFNLNPPHLISDLYSVNNCTPVRRFCPKLQNRPLGPRKNTTNLSRNLYSLDNLFTHIILPKIMCFGLLDSTFRYMGLFPLSCESGNLTIRYVITPSEVGVTHRTTTDRRHPTSSVLYFGTPTQETQLPLLFLDLIISRPQP